MTDRALFDSMYGRANAFYKSLGGCASTHPLWLGAEMPHWFFVFILQHNTLLFVLHRATGARNTRFGNLDQGKTEEKNSAIKNLFERQLAK